MKSLSFKMLFLTLAAFLMLIVGVVLSLYIYFDHFYEPQKINRMLDAINQFSSGYELEEWSDNRLYEEVSSFMKNNNATMSILTDSDNMGIAMAEGSVSTTLSPALVYLSMDAIPSIEISATDAKPAIAVENTRQPQDDLASAMDTLSISTSLSPAAFVAPVEGALGTDVSEDNAETDTYLKHIEAAGDTGRSEDILTFKMKASALSTAAADPIGVPAEEISVAGAFTENGEADASAGSLTLDMATSTFIDSTYVLFPVGMSIALNTDNGAGLSTNEKMGIQYVLSDMPTTDFKQVNFNKTITLEDGKERQIYVNLSMQSVEEVMSILNGFIPFFLIFAVALSLLVARVYAKVVSKPIVEITNVADRMAGMELGVLSHVKRHDELGRLSKSLNTLSSNLKGALDELVLANKQLKQDYHMELRREKARKEFVANVSHEIKTPLGVIKSYTEGLRDGVKSEKREHYMSVILDEIDRMESLVVEMLEISKLDAGAAVYRKKETDIRELIDRTANHFENALMECGLSLRVEGNFGTAEIDEEKINRVLTNLMDNAMKYSEGHSEIILRGDFIEHTQKISIENRCAPLPEEALEKVWDRFYKIDVSHNRDQKGTGLGLAIVKSILEGHGSTYGVENTDDGVRFYFTL